MVSFSPVRGSKRDFITVSRADGESTCIAFQPRSLKQPPHPSITCSVRVDLTNMRAALVDIGAGMVSLRATAGSSTHWAAGVLHFQCNEAPFCARHGVAAARMAAKVTIEIERRLPMERLPVRREVFMESILRFYCAATHLAKGIFTETV